MNRINMIVPSLFFILVSLAGASQSYETALNKYNLANPVEKIYIQLDQDYYVPGETIWFKTYMYTNGRPGSISSNLFIQLFDQAGKHYTTLQYPLTSPVVAGSLLLPDSLEQGTYYLRALTPALLKLDSSFHYIKTIQVRRPGMNNTATGNTQDLNIQFFPESGQLVDGLLTVVAFRATSANNQPQTLNGSIQTLEGSNVAPIRTYHDGIGRVQFRPQAGKKYQAVVDWNGTKKYFPLPEVQTSGVILRVEDEKGGKLFQLARAEKNQQEFDIVTLVVQTNNHVVYENEIAFENYPSVKGHLLTDSLPSGILHFSVFSKKGEVLAERIAFVDNREYRNEPEIKTIKTNSSKRSKQELELKFNAAEERSAAISVTASANPAADNIYSSFLLSSELARPIHHPAWYFNQVGDSARLALDNLLLTQKMSVFNWANIMAAKPAAIVPAHGFLSVTGKVMDDKKKEIFSNGLLNFYIEAQDSTTMNYEAPVDANGAFRLDSLVFFGNSKFYYTYSDKNGKLKPGVVVLDEDPFRSGIAALSFTAPLHNGETIQIHDDDVKTRFSYVKNHQQAIDELERVTVHAKTKKPTEVVEEKYTSGVFRSQSQVTLDNVNYPVNDRSLNVVDYIRNRVQQVELTGGGFVNRKTLSIMSGVKWAVGVFLNEVPVDVAMLRSIRMDDVALVKFFDVGFVGVGSSFPGGAIAVYTKDRFDGEFKPDKLAFVQFPGYTLSKEFYQPPYQQKDFKEPAIDNRFTLYWDPGIIKEQGRTTYPFGFYNNDFSNKLKIRLEGFDAAGRLIFAERLVEL